MVDAAHCTVRVTVTAIVMRCDLCGHRGLFAGPDLAESAAMWSRPHLRPHAVAVRASAGGRDLGWSTR